LKILVKAEEIEAMAEVILLVELVELPSAATTPPDPTPVV